MGVLQGILLVDSHRLFRRTVRETIARRCPGIPVTEAFSGGDAIRKVKLHRPGLIITDIDIHGRRVLGLLQRIREIQPESTIAVLTSYDLPEYREAALANGADLFFSKSASTGRTIEKIIKAELAKFGDHPKKGKEISHDLTRTIPKNG